MPNKNVTKSISFDNVFMDGRKGIYLRFIKFLLKTAIVVAVLCVGIYFVGKYFLLEKATDVLFEELEEGGQLDQVRNYLDQAPEIKGMLESSANVDASTLPFTTKEAAVETVVKKVGVTELYSLQNRYANGMSQSEQLEALNDLEGKLSADEIEALKYVIYNELYK